MTYFEYAAMAREAGISQADLDRLRTLFVVEFPHDSMMCELHILRAVMSIRDGAATVKDILASERRQAVS